MSEYLIETIKLTKRYGKQEALKDLNLHIKEGEIYGFVGRNGAGKTTFIKVLCGLIMPTSGEVKVKRSLKYGVLIEEPGIYPKMSAYRNLVLKGISMGVKDANKEATKILKQVGLSRVGKKRAGNFSLGMRQRLGIGLALVGDPDILLLDEPINGLDPQGIIEMRNLFKRLKSEGKTLIISSHILDELKKVADAYAIIESGQLVKELDNQGLYEISNKKVKIKTDNNSKAQDLIKKLGYNLIINGDYLEIIEQQEIVKKNLTKALVEANVGVEEIYEEAQSSEEVFVKMMGGVNYD